MKPKIIDRINNQDKVLDDKIGDTRELLTVEKTSIVNAINELKRTGVGAGATLNNVFKTTGGKWKEFKAGTKVNTFKAEGYNGTTKTIDIYYRSLLLIPYKHFSINDDGTVALTFELEEGETIDYCISDVSFDYNELANKPDFEGLSSKVSVLNNDRGYLISKEITDADTAIENGIYKIRYDSLNLPESSSGAIEVTRYDASIVFQKLTNALNNTWFRIRKSNEWSAWKKIATTESLNDRGYLKEVNIGSKSCNDIRETGFYFAPTEATDKPSGTSQGHLRVYHFNTSTVLQEYTTYNTNVTYKRVYNGTNGWQPWQQLATNNIEVIAGQTDILSYAKTLKQHFTKTVRCNSAVNNPLGGGVYNDFYYTIYCTDHINGYWNIIASDVMTGTIYTNVCTANVWRGWQQIATTTKTPFSCTVNTGYTILRQNCYVQNGLAYVSMLVKKTDDTAFGIGIIDMAKNPKPPSVRTPISALCHNSTNGSGVISGGNGYVTEATHANISFYNENASTKSVIISGVYPI